MKTIKSFVTHPLYDYDKVKANFLKAVLPFIIIIHHLSTMGLEGIGAFISLGAPVMYLFFAMSGYGLVISYERKQSYIQGFLYRSLPKLFVPYVITLLMFIIYRYFEGVDQIELFKTKGLFSFVPTSWFIYVLALFYVFFFVVFRYVKCRLFVKILLVTVLVLAYYKIAPYVGISPWRYLRTPAFVVGMFFAYFDSFIKEKTVRWHMLVLVAVFVCMIVLSIDWRLESFCYPSIVFLLMYICPRAVFESKFFSFFSSISLEMFIVQYIPIYFVSNHIVSSRSCYSTVVIIALVLILDVILAFAMHKLISLIQTISTKNKEMSENK